MTRPSTERPRQGKKKTLMTRSRPSNVLEKEIHALPLAHRPPNPLSPRASAAYPPPAHTDSARAVQADDAPPPSTQQPGDDPAAQSHSEICGHLAAVSYWSSIFPTQASNIPGFQSILIHPITARPAHKKRR